MTLNKEKHMPGDTRYAEGHAKCRESLICMINKKLSKNVAIMLAIAAVGIPSVFITYAMSANAKDKAKVAELEKNVQVYSIKQDAILSHQVEFKDDLKDTKKEHTKQMESIRKQMRDDKKDIIKEMRRLNN